MIVTCEHNHIHLSVLARNYDPTRTAGIRAAFVREVKRRFAELKKVIRQAIIDNDVFGLQPSTFQLSPPTPRRFAFTRSQDKVSSFMSWLDEQVNKGLLQVSEFQQVGRSMDQAWTNKYISDSYKRGVIRARYELDKAGFDVPNIEQTGGLEISMATPFHLDRLGLLYTRTFEDMRGLTEQMKTQISRTLTQGIADGDNPRLLARKLVATIDGTGMGKLGLTDTLGRFIPAQRRAEMVARTEVIRAHHQATIQEYRNWGAEGVKVRSEWVTAGDDRVCLQCQALEGKVFTLNEIENKIPLHPMCRCLALPVLDSEQEAPVQDEVASGFLNKADGEKYLQYKQEYTGKLNEIGKQDILNKSREIQESAGLVRWSNQMGDLIEKDSSLVKGQEIIRHWGIGTDRERAMALKIWANRLEKTTDVLYPGGPFTYKDRVVAFANEFMTADDYLRIRAFNQAYMETIEFNSITLYRGTDGGFGEKIRESLNNNMQRKQWHMKDSSLAGYSSSLEQANRFGLNVYGVTIRTNVNKADIIIHNDFMGSPFEREWIVKGIDKDVNMTDTSFITSDMKRKPFGE